MTERTQPADHARATLWRHARLATLVGNDWGLIDDGAIVTRGTHIAWVGPMSTLSHSVAAEREIDLDGALVVPGLIDCHTHLVYGGNRADEAEQRLNGSSYEDIARTGGGIRATVQMTRDATDEALFKSAIQRARCLMSEGVTTLEVKSGYGLSLHAEERCLRLARRLARELPLTIRATFLGAHALPPEYHGHADAYIQAVCEWLVPLHQKGLVDAVDAFCESIAFSPDQVRKVFETAQGLGLPVKLHAEQLSDQGGAILAASFGALSCDHLEYLSDDGVAAMQATGTTAVLLPGAFYTLRETRRPPVEKLRAAGVPMAVATDHNPGTAPGLSLLLAAHMACTLFNLTPIEAVQGITRHAALALGLHDRGMLKAGLRADFIALDRQHPNELTYWYGCNPCRRIVIGGMEHAA